MLELEESINSSRDIDKFMNKTMDVKPEVPIEKICLLKESVNWQANQTPTFLGSIDNFEMN